MTTMRVQVEVSPEIKMAAEAQARAMGYPTLATALRVTAVGLAREHRIAQEPKKPEKYKNWPQHIRRDLETVDPAFYRLLVKNGLIN